MISEEDVVNNKISQEAYAEQLQQKHPDATVLVADQTIVHEPWPVARLEKVSNCIVMELFKLPPDMDDTRTKEALLTHKDVAEFEAHHPESFKTLMNRELMSQEKYRSTFNDLLKLRAKVQAGELPNDERSTALATQFIFNNLKMPKDGA